MRNDLVKPLKGLLKQGLSYPQYIQELFRATGLAEWPESAADPTGHDYAEVVIHSVKEMMFTLNIAAF